MSCLEFNYKPCSCNNGWRLDLIRIESDYYICECYTCKQRYFFDSASGDKLYQMIPMELSKEVYEGIVYTQHKTKLKCFVNPILRKIQFWTMKPFVIASESIKLGGEYYFLGYSFKRVSYVK